MMTPLGCRGWVHEAFSEEELETSKTGGLTPSGTVQMKKKRIVYFVYIYFIYTISYS